jgi:hypothetical protein
MIGLFKHVKCEKPLFVGLVQRYFYKPLVAGRHLTHQVMSLIIESNNLITSNRGEVLRDNKEYYY